MSENEIQVRDDVYCVHAFKIIKGRVVGANLRQGVDGKESFIYSIKPENRRDLELYGIIPSPEYRTTKDFEKARSVQRKEMLNYSMDHALSAVGKILCVVQELRDADDTLPRNPDTGKSRTAEKLDKLLRMTTSIGEVLPDIKLDGYTRKGKGKGKGQGQKAPAPEQPSTEDPIPEEPKGPTTLGLALDKALEKAEAEANTEAIPPVPAATQAQVGA